MHNMKLLDQLNNAQKEAVTAPPGNLLVLAGAGSGKTRVLVHRIAWLMEQEMVSPYAILAVTFTNKAANEMKQRITALHHSSVNQMWIGTFHGLAHRLLRKHWQEAGLTETFQILDSEDQHRLIRRTMKQLNIDEEHYPPKQAQWYINSKKDEGKRPQHINPMHHVFEKTMLKIYEAYEQTCQQNGLVDFAELLLRAHELLLKHAHILEHYQNRFEHVLVDEFQDTNTIQYAWLRLLTSDRAHIMIVGDDDQSIYGWRGAKIENIKRFEKDFKNTRTIRLEQNYRSTGNILKASNQLISHNQGRMGKELWTAGRNGDPIELYEAYNDRDEAHYIVSHILKQTQEGYAKSDCAILYRSNAQSRVLEEALLQMNIPYRIYGGMRFFERAEIKDTLAYLRLIESPDNDAAFERIVNFPTRGIGNQTLDEIRQLARRETISMWEATKNVCRAKSLSARAMTSLENFTQLIESLAKDIESLELHEQVEHIIEHSTLLAHFKKEKGEKGVARVENLGELVNAAKEFEVSDDEEMENLTPLAAFLAHAALEAGETQADQFTDSVQLMTLHSAKGLEFPVVFLAGLEEGLFPHSMALGESEDRLEEERRLCYVGMTRAKQKLYLTFANARRLYGHESIQRPSRFLKEMPEECINTVRKTVHISRPSISSKPKERQASYVFDTPKTATHDSGLKIGQSVQHEKFGEGVVLNIEGNGPRAHIEIKFKKAGTKRLMAEYALPKIK